MAPPKDLSQHLAVYITLLESGKMKEAEAYLKTVGLSGTDANRVRIAAYQADPEAKKAAFNLVAGTVGGAGKLPTGLSETGRRLTPTQLSKLRKTPSNATNAAEEFLRKNLGGTLKDTKGGAETFIRENLGLGQGSVTPRPFKGNVDLSKLKNVAEDAFKGVTSRNINLPGRLPSFGKKTIAAGAAAAAAGGGIYSLLNRGDGKSNTPTEADGAGLASITDWVNGLVERSAQMGVEAQKVGRNKQLADLGIDTEAFDALVEAGLTPAQALDLMGVDGGGGGDGSGVGYAQIAEQRRQFDIQNERESTEFTRKFAQDDNQYTMDTMRGMEEFQKNYELQLRQLGLNEKQIAQAAQQFSQSFAENQRQFNTQEGRLNRSLDLETELGRGGLEENIRSNKAREQDAAKQRALAEQQYIGQILSRPSDFLARAFSSRGGTSPYATVTQADLINNLQAGVQGATQGFAKGGTTNEGKFVTGEKGAEVIVNPTNAPIMVLNHEQSQGQMGKLSGYAEGTYDPNQDANFDWFAALNGTQSALNSGTAASGAIDAGYDAGGDYGDFWSEPTQTPTQLPDINKLIPKPTFAPGFTQEMADEALYLSRLSPAARARFQNPVAPSLMQTVQPARPMANQADIISTANQAAPPAVKAAVQGGRIPGARPYGQLTLGRLGKLTQPELEALNTYLAAVGNTDLATEIGLLQQRFGPVVNRSRGRLQV